MDSNTELSTGDEDERVVDPNNPFQTIPKPKAKAKSRDASSDPEKPAKKRTKVYKYDKKHVLISDFIAFVILSTFQQNYYKNGGYIFSPSTQVSKK